MGIAVDVISALIGLGVIAFYAYRGFVRLTLDASKIIVAFFISGFIVPYVAVSDPVLWLLLYIVIFVLICIALTWLFRLIDKIIKKIPIIRTLNSVLGLVLGVGFVYLIFSMAAAIYGTLAAYAPESVFGAYEAELAAGSGLYGFFSEYGLFSSFG